MPGTDATAVRLLRELRETIQGYDEQIKMMERQLRELAEASRKEEGNLRFDVLQHAMRANHFTVIEEWRTAKTIETHAAATHTKEYRSLGPIAGSPLDKRLYKVVE